MREIASKIDHLHKVSIFDKIENKRMPVNNPYAYRSQRDTKKPGCHDKISNITFKTVQRIYLSLTFIIAATLIFRNFHGKFQSSIDKETAFEKVHLRRNDINKLKSK